MEEILGDVLLLGIRMKFSEPLSDTGVVGHGFVLVQDSAQPRVASMYRQLLDEEGIDAIDCQLASQTVQQLKQLSWSRAVSFQKVSWTRGEEDVFKN